MGDKKTSIFWFRRDLRLHDNVGLYHALSQNHVVIPIFIFDNNIINQLPEDDTRVNFIYNQLEKIHEQLKYFDSTLFIYRGDPKDIFEKLISEFKIDCVFTNKDYEPYGINRDQTIKSLLEERNIIFNSYKDHVIFEYDEILKNDGEPYKIYTPYSKKWIKNYNLLRLQKFPSEDLTYHFIKKNNRIFPELSELGIKTSKKPIYTFTLNRKMVNEYGLYRNFPSLDKTSRLGPYLRFGLVSIRRIANFVSKEADQTFLKELIWREFFTQILWHFPYTVTNSFKPKYDKIKWRNNEVEFKLWCEGKTGYPIVDAGMRELNHTGFINNRVRMIASSFLCKHLLIDWRWGEAYFAKKLNDFELSSNIGNWQWVAGCGVDSSPYFRIFNPQSQLEKFDKNRTYIKKWIPEYQEFNYIDPIVEHHMARERCLKTYKKALED